jgi:hypothetical protein
MFYSLMPVAKPRILSKKAVSLSLSAAFFTLSLQRAGEKPAKVAELPSERPYGTSSL